jgi:hypothetical protein
MGVRYSGLSSSPGKCLWTGYADLCITGTVCGWDILTCALVGLFVDGICWPVHQWDCLWAGYADLCISGTVCVQDTLTYASVKLFVDGICWLVHQWDCLWTGYADLCIRGTVCVQDTLTYASVRLCGRDMLTCASVGLFVDRICWPVHQWDSYRKVAVCSFLYVLQLTSVVCLILCNSVNPTRTLNSHRNDHIVQDWWNVQRVHAQIVCKVWRNSFADA